MAEHPHAVQAHRPGTMDIRQQQQTFAGFLRMVSLAAVIIFCVLIFLALANA